MEPLFSSIRRHPWQYAIWILLLVLLGICQVFMTVDLYETTFQPERMAQSLMNEGVDKQVFTSSAKAAGLEDGDRVVAVNGRPYTGIRYLGSILRQAKPNDQIDVSYQRGNETRTVRVTLQAQTPMAAGRREMTVLLVLVMPWFCFLLGFGVVAIRPWDRMAWCLLALLVSFSNSFVQADFSRWPAGVADLSTLFSLLTRFSWGAWFLIFGLYFPERSRLDIRAPWLKWALLVPLGLGIVAAIPPELLAFDHIDLARRLYSVTKPFEMTIFVGFAAVSFSFYALAMKAHQASTADARRKAMLLHWGASASLTPLLLIGLYQFVQRKWHLPAAPPWVVVVAFSCLCLLPLMLGYLVVVHRALDIRIMARQGLQHALARRGVRVLQVSLVFAVVFGVMRFYQTESSSWLRVTVFVLAGLIVFSLRRIADRLRVWADRRFFREAYNSEQLLSELGNQLRTIVETGPLLETVARRVADSLHIEKVALVIRSNGTYRPAYALGLGGNPDWEFSPASAVVERLIAMRRPMTVYFDDPESWVNRLTDGAASERTRLEAMGTQVLLPMNVQDRLLGFVSLGPKRSEEPYSSGDLRLLEAVAGQTALALENSRLTAAVATEVAQRERLNRELEIAREVQQRLLPQKLPQVPGLDYAGHCRPAQSVGGDYYDFLLTPDGKLVLAIGDVSGKGIPAALLMAGLQASLRGLVIGGAAQPAVLMEDMNRLVYESSPRNVFATFFFSIYDAKARTLIYVNAGHNAPLLFRRGAGGMVVTRLNPSGVALGLTGKARYRQSEIALEQGDVLVAYTDGVTEAMNSLREEFGDERLEAAITGAPACTASALISEITAAVDRFVAGAPQHDDLTIVTARI